MSGYRYSLSSTGESSRKFGPCEVCGEHASEVFLQVEEKRFRLDADDIALIPDRVIGAEKLASGGWGWTRYECFSYFGHKQCLIQKRR